MKQRHFGHPESPLFGVYHQARGRKASDGCAVLVCPSIGQEYNRTHWTLRLLANQLSRQGIHVLRMDYHGIGDSAQANDQIDSIEIWNRNVEQAIEHLKAESGAETVMLVGHRFGAALAATATIRRVDVNSVVLWEPVVSGREYLKQLRELHATMLDYHIVKMATVDDAKREELLGFLYDRNLLNEIENLKIEAGAIVQPQLIVDSESANRTFSHPDSSLQKVVVDSQPDSWFDLRELETAWLRPLVLKQMVSLVGDMFDRLKRFNALGLQSNEAGSNPSGSIGAQR